MPTRYFEFLWDCSDYFEAATERGLDDLEEIRFDRTPNGFRVTCVPRLRQWRLEAPNTSDASRGGVDADPVGPKGDDPGPATIIDGGPRRVRRKSSTTADPAPGHKTGDQVQIDVLLTEQDFTRDRARAVIDSDPSGYLDRTVSLMLRGLSDDEWGRLLAAGRSHDVCTLKVRMIAGTLGRPSRSRLSVEEVVAIKRLG